jgi:23S rRNA (adenine2503-C2)-methyltransferase
MIITKNIQVPTGNILIVEGQKGQLEMLSLGDYGKEHNLKADFLGLDRDLTQVKHTKLLPLEEKWVITVSTQYTCNMGCNFCDVPKVKVKNRKDINATVGDLLEQILTGLDLHEEVKYSKHLNVHFARMGEPTFNPSVLQVSRFLKENSLFQNYKIHPVVSTIMPLYNEWLIPFIHEWMKIKNEIYKGNAGLQISINSTNDKERDLMFCNNACDLEGIAYIMDGIVPIGRKITLNFAVANYEIDPDILLKYFDPRYYLIKLTPMHKTKTALENNIKTEGDYTTYYPYKEIEKKLKKAGYDVLVFIASLEEDMGRITCGNAILSGTKPEI